MNNDIGRAWVPRLSSFERISDAITGCDAAWVALCVGCEWNEIEADDASLRRMASLCCDAGAVAAYSDYDHPLIDYSAGGVRDDFDFGPIMLFRRDKAEHSLREMESDFGKTGLNYGGFYALRLSLSRYGNFLHVREPLYAKTERDMRLSGEKQFDYVNPANRDVQTEMERIFTVHLRKIGALLPPPVGRASGDFERAKVTASVVIPVRNRVKTISDAVQSAISQKTDFPFNVLVVDNHSDDGTSEVLDDLASSDGRVIHIVPERHDLMIGGCWNRAVFDERCGRFAVQLDSDDVYSSENTLQTVVDKMKEGAFAMLVGSYLLTDFDLNPIPPGVIDHKEWTDENGHNNALRVNGLGAPRAFDTAVLRSVGGFPNVSYGEDYAVGLRITREYRLGRIYDVLYNCRRWSGNSDSALSQEKINRNNEYKDMLRAVELGARIKLNGGR